MANLFELLCRSKAADAVVIQISVFDDSGDSPRQDLFNVLPKPTCLELGQILDRGCFS